MMAAGLARKRLLRTYITPFGRVPDDNRSRGTHRLPDIGGRIASELRRRELPGDLAGCSIEHVCSGIDLTAALTARLRPLRSLAPTIGSIRDSVFDGAVARRLARSDAGVITVSGAAQRTLVAANKYGVVSLLECPVAHYRAAERLLAEEARREPDYAATLQFHDLPAWLKRRLDAEFRGADKLLVLSTYQQETFTGEGIDLARMARVPLGVDTDLFRPLSHSRSSESARSSEFRVIFVGQITQRKGISYLFEGFRKASIPQSRLLLVGRVVGTDRPWRARPSVEHLNHVPRWELPNYYQASDVYVLPSLVEGFPLTAAEAMACGLTVIVSEHTFAHDVINDGVDGFVVPIRDSAAIADRLRFLYENPDKREAMGLAARKTAERFSWRHYGERVVKAVELSDVSPDRNIGADNAETSHD